MSKPTKYVFLEQKEYKSILLEFNRWTVYVSASEMSSFPKEDNNYNEIDFSLASIKVWNNKNTHNLSQCQHVYPIPNHVYAF